MCARILIIDDDPTNIDLLARLVQAFGHEPVRAERGEEALALIQSDVPDLILCDVHMPGMDGFEVLRRCRLSDRLHDVRIVAVTALAMVGDRERLLKAGFDGYLSKPIEPETFVTDLNRFLPTTGIPQIAPRPSAPPSPGPPRSAAHRGKGYVLVIDDSRDNRLLTQHLLESCGFEVVAAEGASAALNAATQRTPALVICDVHMPDPDGYSILRSFRTLPGARETPFIFLSSSSDGNDIARGLAVGACRFIVRPIEPEALLKELESFLEV